MRLAAPGVVAIALLTACTSERLSPPKATTTQAIGATPQTNSSLICGFIPSEAAEIVTGTAASNLQGQGQIRDKRYDHVIQAACDVTLEKSGETLMGAGIINVQSASARDVEQRMKNLAPGDQLLSAPLRGLVTSEQHIRPDGQKTERPIASLFWGEWLIEASIEVPATGRDARQDAIDLTQQIAHALKLSPTAPTPAP